MNARREVGIIVSPEKHFGRAGYAYEAWDGSGVVCEGWAAGHEATARRAASEHVDRVLRARAKRAAAAITGEALASEDD